MNCFRILEILLLLQHCNAFGFFTGNIEGAGVCGCEFSCGAFVGSGATTCYIIYHDDGIWHHEEHSLIHEEFLEQTECNTGLRQQCYMFAVYPSYLQLSCVDSHRACRRASGSIAKMDTNNELYDFTTILAGNIMTDYQISYSYKAIAGDVWYYNSFLKNTCADVQSLVAYGSNIQASSCGQTFKPVNSILCENSLLPIYTYCASSTPTNSPPVRATKKQHQPTTHPVATHALQPRGTVAPKQFTNAMQPTLKMLNPGPERPHLGSPNPLPTWWPQAVTVPTSQAPTQSKFKKKKKMVVDHIEPNNKKKKSNVTQLVTGICFVGTILMIGFALLVGCFFGRRNDDEQTDTGSFRWSNASEPLKKSKIYEEVDARNAVSDHEDGYSVINTGKRRQNKRIGSVSKKLSQEDCRRYRLSKAATSTEIKCHGNSLNEVRYQQSPSARNESTYKTRVRCYDVDRTSSGVSSIASSRSSALYEIRDFLEYDYAYTNNRYVVSSDPYVVGNIQDPSYDYAHAPAKCVKKTKKKRPRHKRDTNLHGDV